jgi:maltokinase
MPRKIEADVPSINKKPWWRSAVARAAALQRGAVGQRDCRDGARHADPPSGRDSGRTDLRAHADALFRAYDELASYGRAARVQRVHGDLHLGRRCALDGWKIIDFEGDSAHPLTERRMPSSPLRNVAGMLRSFDYAARHLMFDRPDPQLEYGAVEWSERNREAFRDGCAEASGRDPRDDGLLLRAFEIDKVVYKVVYEARNRPSWLPIPMAAVERLAA